MAFRQIHDDVPLSTSLNKVSHLAERLYWRMLSRTDMWGRLPGEQEKIRAAAIPLLHVTDEELAEALAELEAVGRIARAEVDGAAVCQLLEFEKSNPNIAKLKRAPSRYPEIPACKVPAKSGIGKERKKEQKQKEEERLQQSSYVPKLATPRAALPEMDSESAGEALPSAVGAIRPSPYADSVQETNPVPSGEPTANSAQPDAVPVVQPGAVPDTASLAPTANSGDDDLGREIAARVAKREAGMASHGRLAPLLEVLPILDDAELRVLHSVYDRLPAQAVLHARNEIRAQGERLWNPKGYAVGIAKRLAREGA